MPLSAQRLDMPKDIPHGTIVLAAIDVGTNAARLMLAHLYPDGRLIPFYKRRAPIRPGEGVFASGAMADAVAGRLIETLRGFAGVCRAHDARVRAVATSSLRDAANAKAVLRRIRHETGINLHVISGEEEAHLISRGILAARASPHQALLIDIGGGSTEISLVADGRPALARSLQLGTVRITEQYRLNRRISAERLTRVRRKVGQVVTEQAAAFLGQRLPPVAFGSSGTIRAIARRYGSKGSRLPCAALPAATEAFAALKGSQRRKLFSPQRAEVLLAGLIILDQLCARLAIPHLEAVNEGLRDGLLVAMRDEQMAGDAATPTALT